MYQPEGWEEIGLKQELPEADGTEIEWMNGWVAWDEVVELAGLMEYRQSLVFILSATGSY